MPKLLPSPGRVVFTTPVNDELQRYICYELVNAKEWNPGIIEGGMNWSSRGWKFEIPKMWSIEFNGRELVVTSEQPIVVIRQGLQFRMGQQRIEIYGVTK